MASIPYIRTPLMAAETNATRALLMLQESRPKPIGLVYSIEECRGCTMREFAVFMLSISSLPSELRDIVAKYCSIHIRRHCTVYNIPYRCGLFRTYDFGNLFNIRPNLHQKCIISYDLSPACKKICNYDLFVIYNHQLKAGNIIRAWIVMSLVSGVLPLEFLLEFKKFFDIEYTMEMQERQLDTTSAYYIECKKYSDRLTESHSSLSLQTGRCRTTRDLIH